MNGEKEAGSGARLPGFETGSTTYNSYVTWGIT